MNPYVLIALLCSFLFAVGAILCKYSMRKLNTDVHPNIFELAWFLIRNRIWFLGVFVSLGTNAIVLQIQSVLDLSIIHSILTSTYIFTLLLGYLFLEEKLTPTQWFGTLTVFIGTTAILFIGEPITGGETRIDNLIMLSILSMSIITLLLLFAKTCEKINYEVTYAISAGVSFGNCQVYVKASTNMIEHQTGSFSVLSLQSISEFLHIWPSLALILFSVTGFLCMHISFSHGKISICVALLAVISRTISTSSGYYVYGEHFSALKILSIAIILTGVFIITLASLKKEERILSPA
jgi:multidrug transporter EmrE-like cation transporter